MVFISSLLFSGLVVLSLSMNRHYKIILQRKLARQQVFPLRLAGWMLLSVCMILCVLEFGFGIGLTTFFAVLSLVGFVQILLLSYAPKTLMPLALLLPMTSGLSWIIT